MGFIKKNNKSHILAKNHTRKMSKNIKLGLISVCVGILFITFSVGIKFTASVPFMITDSNVLVDRTSRDLRLFEFQIDNVNYQVPTPCKNFLLEGWVLTENPMIPAGRSASVLIEKDSKRLFLVVKNQTTETLKVSQCTVIQVLIQSSPKEDEIPIFFGKDGFTLRMNERQVEQVFGKPNRIQQKGNETAYLYRYGTSAAIEIIVDRNIGTIKIAYHRK